MAAIDVIILFVGLTTFSAGVPGDCGLKAIAPRVIYRGPNATERRTQVARKISNVRTTEALQHQHLSAETLLESGFDTPQVETHATAIIYETDSYLVNTNWIPHAIPTATGETAYSYVLLDGDRVRFVTPGVTNPPASLANVVLPKLPQVCTALTKLRRDYLPPYRGAAAVFDIPEGTVNSCKSTGQHPPYGQRLDTKIAMQTTGTFVISASTMTTTKELRLKPGADGFIRVAVATVPIEFLNATYTPKPPNAVDGLSHVHAYYAMGDGNPSTCSMTLKNWFDNNVDPNDVADCNQQFSGTGKLIPGASRGPFLPREMIDAMIYNFECSNTQWP
jgi:hypothetical protein